MGTRTVTGTVGGIEDPEEKTVLWTLEEEFETTTEVFPIQEFEIPLDANGFYSTSLPVPDSGTAHYTLRLTDRVPHPIYLAAGPAVDQATLIVIAGMGVDPDDLQVLMDQAELLQITSISSARVMDGTEDLVRITAGTFTQTLPAATGTGKPYAFINEGYGLITVAGAGSDLLNEASTYLLSHFDRVVVVDVAAGQWDIMGF